MQLFLLPVLAAVLVIDFLVSVVDVLARMLRVYLTKPTIDAIAQFVPQKWRPEKPAAGGCLDCKVLCQTREEWDEHLRQHHRQQLPREQ